MAPKRIQPPEIGEEDFQRLLGSVKSREVREALESAVEWCRLGTKHLLHLKRSRAAQIKWARKQESYE